MGTEGLFTQGDNEHRGTVGTDGQLTQRDSDHSGIVDTEAHWAQGNNGFRWTVSQME